MKDQQVLGLWAQCQLFRHSVETLYSQLQEKGEGAELVWDKVTGSGAASAADGGSECVCVCFQWLTSNSSLQDEPAAMDFVTAAANLRMHIFSMNMKSLFDVKCKSPADAVGLCVCLRRGIHIQEQTPVSLFQQWQGTSSPLSPPPTPSLLDSLCWRA